MANLRQAIGSMKLTGNVGLRYVRTGQESDGFFTAPQGGEPLPLQINRNYQRLLPSANLSLRVTPDLVFRTAYSEVFSRPNFVDLSPARNLNYVTLEGSGGNPVLQPYTAKQYDATVEYYFGRPGFAYFGLFRKDLDGYYQRVVLPEVIEGQTFLISQLINTDKAKITGWEAGYQQQFDFLPGILSGLGARYAFTHINSNRFNSQLNRDEPLAGLSKNAYNLMLTYEKSKIRWNIAYNWRQQYPIVLDPGGALNLPQVRASFGIWDGSITYQMRPNLAVFFDMSNITGVRGEEYFTRRDRPRAFFLSDQTIGFGIRSNF
jgi:TonB-dependent receptor